MKDYGLEKKAINEEWLFKSFLPNSLLFNVIQKGLTSISASPQNLIQYAESAQTVLEDNGQNQKTVYKEQDHKVKYWIKNKNGRWLYWIKNTELTRS